MAPKRKKKEPPKPWQNDFEGLSDGMLLFVDGAKEQIYSMRSARLLAEFEKVNTQGLTELCLPKQGFAAIPAEIAECKGLVKLDLNHNIIDEGHIDPAFWSSPNMQSIKVLDLTSNRLTLIPPEIASLSGLEVLRLGCNQIAEIPSEIGECTKIQELVLCNNDIMDLKESMGNFTQLRFFDIGHNSISTLPNSCHKWQQLEILIAQNNKLIGLPVGVGGWGKVVKLNFKGNAIAELPPEIQYWKSIEELDFAWNDMPALNEEFMTLTTLRKLYLAHNNLKTSHIGGIANFTKLEDLFLSKNLLEKGIPRDFGQLTNLRRVSLAGNKMKSLPAEVGEWVKVEEVYLSQNDFEKLPATIANWKCLRELVCSKCEQLSLVTPSLAEILTLVNLDFRETQVEIPEEFKKIPPRIPPLYIRGGLSGAGGKAKKKK